MTDRELLELAAKAAGIVNVWAVDIDGFAIWNPLTDDGDEARLETALRFDVVWFDKFVVVGTEEEVFSDHGGDAQKARRYAGVRSAARVGKAMP